LAGNLFSSQYSLSRRIIAFFGVEMSEINQEIIEETITAIKDAIGYGDNGARSAADHLSIARTKWVEERARK